MVSLSSIQANIDNKLFGGDIHSTCILYTKQSSSTNKWGDATVSFNSGSSVKVIPYNYVPAMESYEPFGDLQASESVMVFQHTVNVSEEDKISFDGKTFTVKEVEKYPYGGGFILKLVRVAEVQ